MTDKNQFTKILIAEDDDFFLRITSRQLNKLGYETIAVRDGKEAWEQVNISKPDLIISDWMMPELSGAELCEKIRSDDEFKYIYFIMVTARDRVEDLVKGLELGADDFLTKPCDIQELIARVNTGIRIITLQKSYIQLQRAQAINEMAITANHEINNPLQAIMNTVELILTQKENLDESTEKGLQAIINNVSKIRKVTRQLEQLITTSTKEYTIGGPLMIDLEKSTNPQSESGTKD